MGLRALLSCVSALLALAVAGIAPIAVPRILAQTESGQQRFICTADATGYVEETSIDGGPGLSLEEPLIVHAVSSSAGIASEYAYLAVAAGEPTGDWFLLAQALTFLDDDQAMPVDVLVLWIPEGTQTEESDVAEFFFERYQLASGEVRAYFFAIERFFGREPGDLARCVPLGHQRWLA